MTLATAKAANLSRSSSPAVRYAHIYHYGQSGPIMDPSPVKLPETSRTTMDLDIAPAPR